MSSYLHLAKADLKYAHFGLTQCTDEVDVNYAAYHVHQAIEKIAKGLLEMNGEDIARRLYRTHDISFLLSRLPEDVYVPPIISERTFDIMRWVSEPRYNVNFRLSKDSVYDVYKETLYWLEVIIPPIKGTLVKKSSEFSHSRTNPSESYDKKPANKSPNAKHYPKKQNTKNRKKTKKKKPRA